MMEFEVHSVNFRVKYRDIINGTITEVERVKNSWRDFHLVPANLPMLAPPGVKTSYLDIPGGDGAIDASTVLTGFPTFQNRTGEFQFDLLDENYYPIDNYIRWAEAYSDIMDFFHGQQMQCYLTDDASYYYEGRFAVKSWTPGQKPSRVVIEYNVKPYKRTWETTMEDWLWDPFVFPGGIIRNGLFSNLEFGQNEVRYDFGFDDESIVGTMAVRPEVIITTSDHNGAYVKVMNHKYNVDLTNAYPDEPYPDGHGSYAGIVFAGGYSSLFVKTGRANVTGAISIRFRPGRL